MRLDTLRALQGEQGHRWTPGGHTRYEAGVQGGPMGQVKCGAGVQDGPRWEQGLLDKAVTTKGNWWP